MNTPMYRCDWLAATPRGWRKTGPSCAPAACSTGRRVSTSPVRDTRRTAPLPAEHRTDPNQRCRQQRPIPAHAIVASDSKHAGTCVGEEAVATRVNAQARGPPHARVRSRTVCIALRVPREGLRHRALFVQLFVGN